MVRGLEIGGLGDLAFSLPSRISATSFSLSLLASAVSRGGAVSITESAACSSRATRNGSRRSSHGMERHTSFSEGMELGRTPAGEGCKCNAHSVFHKSETIGLQAPSFWDHFWALFPFSSSGGGGGDNETTEFYTRVRAVNDEMESAYSQWRKAVEVQDRSQWALRSLVAPFRAAKEKWKDTQAALQIMYEDVCAPLKRAYPDESFQCEIQYKKMKKEWDELVADHASCYYGVQPELRSDDANEFVD